MTGAEANQRRSPWTEAAPRPPAPATPRASQPTARSRWIISAGQDLLWLHGSVTVGLTLLLVFALAPPLGADMSASHPALLALLAWGVLFDGTHVLGTYARSYLAPDATSRTGLPGALSLSLIAVGPAIALIDHAMTGALFPWFLLGASLWAYWHLVRQHWGFVVLYRRKLGADPTPEAIDQAVLWIGCLYPFVRFSLTPAYASTGLPQLLPVNLLGPTRLAVDALAAALAALIVVWALRRRRELGPKHLLMAIVIGFHVAVFASLDQLLPITATLTVFHNLQYHRIVWQYERGHGRRPLGGLVPYLLLGVALGLLWYVPRVAGGFLAPSALTRNLCLGFGWGVAFHHYLIDGRIWRVRRVPAIGRALDAGANTRAGA